MKRMRIAAILLAMVVGLCILTHYYQHSRVDRMLDALNRLEETHRLGNVTESIALAKALTVDFASISAVMGCYVPHSALAESLETSALLPALLQRGGEEELKMELNRLREQLNHLRQIDDLTLYNIL